MKLATVWGGFTGFLIVVVAGFLVQRDPLLLFFDSCVASAVGGALFQWWHRLYVRELHAWAEQQRANVPSEESSRKTEGKHTSAT